MKKMLFVLVALMMLLAAGCAGNTNDAKTEVADSAVEQSPQEPAENDTEVKEAEVVEDVQQAIDFTLPVTGVGREIQSNVTANEKYKIAVILKNNSNPYFVGIGDGGLKAGEDLGVEVSVYSPTTPDSVEEQVTIMETVIQQGVDGIVVVPVDSNGIMPGVDQALEAGIPMAAIGTAPTTEVMLRTGYDYIDAGYTTAVTLAEAAGGKGGAIILEGPPGAQNANECLKGINMGLAEYPDIEILASQTANYRRAEGMQVMENLVQKFKDDISLVVAANDEMALGAVEALKAAGINAQVVSGGPGGSKDACQAIENGDLYCAYNTDPFGGAYLSTVYITQFLNDGSTPPQYFIPFPSKETDPMITKETVENYKENLSWWK